MPTSFKRPAKAIELTSNTLPAYPINPEFFIRKEGLKIKRVSGEEYKGVEGKADVEGKTVILNSSLNERQSREVAARLLGLYYADTLPETQEMSQIERVSYAVYFGTELLMPEKEVRKAWFDGLSENEICAFFGVSPAALDIRLKQIGIL